MPKRGKPELNQQKRGKKRRVKNHVSCFLWSVECSAVRASSTYSGA